MKKATIMKKGAAFTLAAMMAFGVSTPAAVFASEGTEDPGNEAPAVEKQVEKQEAPKAEVKQEAPKAEAKQSTPQAEPKQSAPQAETPTVENQEAPAVENQEAPAVENQEAPAVVEEEPVVEESPYGEKTGAWGYGNSTQTTKWVEYKNGKESILVFSTVGDSNTDEENAVTQLLDEYGNIENEEGINIKEDLKARVTQVVFETGITGIGWTALFTDKKNYQPLYDESYEINPDKTDVFKGFEKLAVVIPCETIKRIGWSAFRNCYALKEFDFTKCTQLEEIMNQAFNNCKLLNTVDLSNCNALRTINYSAFNGAGKGKNASLSLPTDGVLSVIGGYAFYQYANKNAAGTEVDFSTVAGSVTKVLQKAFAGSNIVGTIAGFKELTTFANDAITDSRITYIPYDPSQEEEEETPAQEEPQVPEEPAAPEEPVAQEETPAQEEPVVQEETPAQEEEDVAPMMEEVITPVIQEVVAPVINIESADSAHDARVKATATNAKASATTVKAKAAATNAKATAANANAPAANSAAGRTVIDDSAAPATAPIQTASVDDNAVPMAAVADEQTLPGYLFGAFALAALMALATAFALMRKPNEENR